MRKILVFVDGKIHFSVELVLFEMQLKEKKRFSAFGIKFASLTQHGN